MRAEFLEGMLYVAGELMERVETIGADGQRYLCGLGERVRLTARAKAVVLMGGLAHPECHAKPSVGVGRLETGLADGHAGETAARRTVECRPVV